MRNVLYYLLRILQSRLFWEEGLDQDNKVITCVWASWKILTSHETREHASLYIHRIGNKTRFPSLLTWRGTGTILYFDTYDRSYPNNIFIAFIKMMWWHDMTCTDQDVKNWCCFMIIVIFCLFLILNTHHCLL